ncbi:NAD(P)H-binding protein [Streptomyces sp. NPDC000963]|uniref:NAD(P)H-binding protein n=1 Tax=Streptomyces sp. NPDC007872 TaxID=3364782 RepID=UPI0036B16E77
MTPRARTSRHIVLTGATGRVASLTARHLAAAGHRLTLVSRTARTTGLPPGARHVACDYDNPALLAETFRGADAVLVVTNDPTRPAHDRNIVRAAVEASAGHLVKLSAAAVHDPAADDLVTTWQRENERLVRDSGIPWTLLQPRSFMTHALAWAPGVRDAATTRALHPHSRNACIAPEDIAEVAALVLGDDDHHHRSYRLTGPRALSAHEQTEVLAALLGRPLTCLPLTPDEARALHLLTYPRAMADALLASADRQAAGAKSGTTDTVERLTGRAPTTFAQWAAAHLHRFAPARTEAATHARAYGDAGPGRVPASVRRT